MEVESCVSANASLLLVVTVSLEFTVQPRKIVTNSVMIEAKKVVFLFILDKICFF